MEIALSLGSNLGDRMNHLRDACKRLAALPETTITKCSPVYETAPVGVKPQYRDMPYLNAVILIETQLPVDALSTRIHRFEAAMGRIRSDDRFAPRPIDIDILYAGDHIRNDETLTLPHPRWAQRRFVLQPLADVRPERVLPGYQQTVRERLDALDDDHAVNVFARSL